MNPNKILVTALSVAVLLSLAAMAFAAGGYLPWPVNKNTPIQGDTIAPAVGASRCDTVTGVAAVQKRYSAAGYIKFHGEAHHPTTGAPIVVKWQEDGTAVWADSNYKMTNDQGQNVTYVTPLAFGNHTAVFCVRRE
jgi:hypothetical protein